MAEFKCIECGGIFTSPQGLGAHRKKIHNVVGTSSSAMYFRKQKEQQTLNGSAAIVEKISLADQIAQKIVEKVLYHAANPIVQVRVESDPQALLNIQRLQDIIEQLNKENEELKHKITSLQKSRQRFTDHPLTQQIKELLTTEEWTQLMQEVPKGVD